MRSITLVLSGILLFNGFANSAFAQQAEASKVAKENTVDFVRICESYGDSHYYIPGTETCMNAGTGETRTETADGTVVGHTELAKRVELLEEKIEKMEEYIGRIVTIE